MEPYKLMYIVVCYYIEFHGWTDQLRNDTGSVPANLWRQAILRAHGGATLYYTARVYYATTTTTTTLENAGCLCRTELD